MNQPRSLWRVVAGALVAASLAALSNPSMAAGAAEGAYISGGIGDDDPMIARKSDYNLHLILAMKGSGEYLADIDISIENSKGAQIVNARSSGPFFYVNLPAGSYRVTASFDGKTLNKTTTIHESGARDLYFYW